MKRSLIILTLISFNGLLFAQNTPDPDWPCIQVLIPKISAATVWDGPPIEDSVSNEVVSASAEKLITNVMDNDNKLTEQDIDNYLAKTQETEANKALTYLFMRFLNRLNDKRSTQIKTIKRYTKTQRDSAATIEALLDKITSLQNQSDKASELQELESELHWQKRMFKERETSFKYLCELPQEIFQQAGEIARTISMKLNY